MSETTTIGTSEPEWLDKLYLTKILNQITQNRLNEISEFKKAPATKKGENFVSVLYLVSVSYSTKDEPDKSQTSSLIIKTRLDNQIMSQIEEEFNIFSREVQVYSIIMHEMENLLKNIGDKTKLGPQALYYDERIIVLENLKFNGYAIADVKNGLNFEECALVLKKLAKFHALSMILNKTNPDMFRYHLPGNITEHSSLLHGMFINAITTTIEYCKLQPNLAEYVPQLVVFGEKIIPKMINVFSRNQADRYHVLNHGDVWVNNVMFKKHEDGSLADVLFIDYQEGFYGSPGIDFNYFIFSSWQSNVLTNHFADLIEVYHKNLTAILHAFNYEQRIPTIKDVEKEIINKGFHGLATATCLLPILINEHTHLADPENFLFDTDEANKNRQKIFDNPAFGKKLEVFLKFFKNNGIL